MSNEPTRCWNCGAWKPDKFTRCTTCEKYGKAENGNATINRK